MPRNTLNAFCNDSMHLSRRRLLGGGGGAIGSVALSSIAHRLALAEEKSVTPRPRSVILLWLSGGPSQLDSFDPHPGTRIGGDIRAIETTNPAIQIAETLPRTAEVMHLASLVRSVVGKEGDHERAIYHARNGFRPDPTLVHPSVGAILCNADQRGADIPRHISILPDPWPGRGGYLGPALDAFKIGDPAGPIPDVSPRVNQERFDRRFRDLHQVVDKEFARGRLVDLQRTRTLHRSVADAARRMMSSDQLSAFDVDREPESVRREFGKTAFGRGVLAASRLIEVGVRCVEVTLTGWDTHANNHDGQAAQCAILDPAIAALMRRLERRERLDETLVVVAGEFGRTPKINPAGGRDHWPHGFAVMLAGCGIRRGGLVGSTNPAPKLDAADLSVNVDRPVSIGDLHATILSAIGLPFATEVMTPIGRPLHTSEGQPIETILT